MIKRFEGESGRRTLTETLRDQKIVAGDAALAKQIAATAELFEVKPGGAIIEQGARTTMFTLSWPAVSMSL